ncbi:hypothetical protein As57867_004043, partial [Aphanomyces stellatus]
MSVASATQAHSSFKGRIKRAHTSWDIWALGITIVIGGQFTSWNAGLTAGSAGFGMSVLLVGLAYVCLACSVAEMTSMLPFAGGVYGLSRCTLGFYAGFVLGCFEVFEYTLYVSSINVALGKSVTSWWPILQPYEPLVWAASYSLSTAILVRGGRVFWSFNLLLAITLLGLILLFVFGSIPYASLDVYAGGSDHAFVGGFSQWLTSLPLAMWFFTGIEALNPLCNEIDTPRHTIPRGQVSSMLTIFVSSIAVYLTTISLPPGITALASVMTVFNGGYSQLFPTLATNATLLSLPAIYSGAPGLLLSGGNIIASLADSKLIPHALRCRH